MFLNSDILFAELSSISTVTRFGHSNAELTLKRPLFWYDSTQNMEDDRIYIVRSDRCPPEFQIGMNDLLICVGGNNVPEGYLGEHYMVFTLEDFPDLLEINNLIQRIFDKYDAWEIEVKQIIDTDADLQKIIDISRPIIKFPVAIMDKDFHYLAHSKEPDKFFERKSIHEGDSVSGGKRLYQYFQKYGTKNMFRHDVFLSKDPDESVLFTKNIFDRTVYMGNVSVYIRSEAMAQAAPLMLIQFFFSFVEKAYQKTSVRVMGSRQMFKEAIIRLLNCHPLDTVQKKTLRSEEAGSYLCIRMQMRLPFQKTPVDYCCTRIESLFPGSIAFEYEAYVISILYLGNLNGNLDENKIENTIRTHLSIPHLIVSISNPFTDITLARQYYRQACIAEEIGRSLHPEKMTFRFRDYLLDYILFRCTGEFAPEFLLQEYCGQLIKHDQDSPIKYIDTLRTFMDNNMNVQKTAEILYLHRSTLVSRLSKIKKSLQIDLNDPNQRFMLNILLKAHDEQALHVHNTPMQ